MGSKEIKFKVLRDFVDSDLIKSKNKFDLDDLTIESNVSKKDFSRYVSKGELITKIYVKEEIKIVYHIDGYFYKATITKIENKEDTIDIRLIDMEVD